MAEPTVEDHKARYFAAAHAMQTGVAFEMHLNPTVTEPKHLRTGVNSALVDVGALAGLLVKKGLITELEYFCALADNMERERDLYQARLTKLTGSHVTLA